MRKGCSRTPCWEGGREVGVVEVEGSDSKPTVDLDGRRVHGDDIAIGSVWVCSPPSISPPEVEEDLTCRTREDVVMERL